MLARVRNRQVARDNVVPANYTYQFREAFAPCRGAGRQIRQTGGANNRDRRILGIRWEVVPVSIVRIGLAETKGFEEGYEAIFGKKEKPEAKKPEAVAKTAKAKPKKKKKKK